MNFNPSNVYVVGAVDNPQSKIIRVVHISDTMGCEDKLFSQIPYGHILIHSGDFGKSTFFNPLWRSRAFLSHIDNMNRFFNHLPHPHKIYVAGSNDSHFSSMSKEQIQSLLPPVNYLQDSWCQLYSLFIYGTPWVKKRLKISNAFTKDFMSLSESWEGIPSNTDILISNQKPWEATFYKHISTRIKPILHLYGKNDGNYGVLFKDDIIFSNASFQSYVNFRSKLKTESYGFWSQDSLESTLNSKTITCFQRQKISQPGFYIKSREHYEPIVFDVYVPPKATVNCDDLIDIN